MRTAWMTPGRGRYGLVAGDPSDGADDPDHDGLTSAQECVREVASAQLLFALPGGRCDRAVLRHADRDRQPERVDGPCASEVPDRHGPQRDSVPAACRRCRGARCGRRSSPGWLRRLSTVVESDVEVVVDRTMLWGQGPRPASTARMRSRACRRRGPSGTLPRGRRMGLRPLLSAPEPRAPRRYRPHPLPAAGATGAGRARLHRPGPAPAAPSLSTLCPGSRRPTYRRYSSRSTTCPSSSSARCTRHPGRRGFESGHDSAAIAAPATRWFLAEGATGAFFNTYLLLANPNATSRT